MRDEEVGKKWGTEPFDGEVGIGEALRGEMFHTAVKPSGLKTFYMQLVVELRFTCQIHIFFISTPFF